MLKYEELEVFLNSKWSGKGFVYVSKYGSETKGIIDTVRVNSAISFDKETTKRIKEKVESYKRKEEERRNELRKAIDSGDRDSIKQSMNNKVKISSIVELKERKEARINNDYNWCGYSPAITIKSTNNQTYKLGEIFILD